ncbi:hypothetical protein BaRGS_00004390 [Batillaria attramentaria]|uniref:Uncharacterized protein n=1 Tax=Batillaria attramentaria TaxID=370345 RepID=A0ABD0LYJ2_9CAEN
MDQLANTKPIEQPGPAHTEFSLHTPISLERLSGTTADRRQRTSPRPIRNSLKLGAGVQNCLPHCVRSLSRANEQTISKHVWAALSVRGCLHFEGCRRKPFFFSLLFTLDVIVGFETRAVSLGGAH